MSGVLSRIFNRAKAPVAAMMNHVVALTGQFHIKSANAWRDQYNPIRGLTMRRVVSLLEEGERGAYAELQWLYRFLEKRDATLRGGKRNLLGALGAMDWEIRTVDEEKLPPGATVKMAEKQRDSLRAAYDRIDNLRAAIEHLGLAEFRGFAHLEKCRAAEGPNDGAVIHLEPIEQWYLVRDGLNGAWQYNKDARFGVTKGEEIDATRVIVREIEDPINEIALIAFVRKQLSQKDWDGFVESFGIPSIFAVMPQQVPAGQEDKFLEVAERVIGNSRGVLPAGADIKVADGAGQRGQNPFAEHLGYQDEQIVLAVTSGLLTMLAESGSGTLAGGAHTNTFERVARALAGRVSETFQRQFDAEILGELHPNEPVLAYFAIAAEEETDTGEFIAGVKTLKDAGYQVSAGQIAEKTGYEVEMVKADPKAETGNLKPESKGAMRNRGRISNYNPSQARDAYGRWDATGVAYSREELAKAGLPGKIVAAYEAAVGFDAGDPLTWPKDMAAQELLIADAAEEAFKSGGFAAFSKKLDESAPLYEQAAVLAEQHDAVIRYVEHRMERLGAILNRAKAATADALGVPVRWLDPVAAWLDEIEAKAADASISDADLVAFLGEAQTRLPELFDGMGTEDLAGVFEAAFGGAALAGLKEGMNESRGDAETRREQNA